MDNNPRKKLREAAMNVTRWIGSIESIWVHTFLFVGSFLAVATGLVTFDRMLLVLTTLVSLEAIYLAIFIQMTINFTTETLEEVEHDIDEIQEEIDELDEEEKEDEATQEQQQETLNAIQAGLKKLMADIEQLQKQQK